MQIKSKHLLIQMDESTGLYEIHTKNKIWIADASVPATLQLHDQIIAFCDAESISHKTYTSGIGQGIRSTYTFKDFSFQTNIWIEDISEEVYFEWIPLQEHHNQITQVDWPLPFVFDQVTDDQITLIPYLQGLMIPNTWEKDVQPLHFNGQFGSSAAYMPWFAQIDHQTGYLAIAATEWDGGYAITHPHAGPTSIHPYWLPTLGKMDYKRVMRIRFFDNCDYNSICKSYRQYAIETGRFVTLKEKEIRNASVSKLIGSCVVHKGIKKHIDEHSIFFDKEHPENNDSLTTFAFREKEMRFYKEKGVEKLYLHLDGWSSYGYDNHHPDILPPCQEAGGWEGLQSLSQTMKDCGYLFGIHDQYRDYYFDAETFDSQYACHDVNGNIFDMARWAGGRQSYLCTSLAPHYVKRNFEQLIQGGIHLDAAYLDVFTCNEPDECNHAEHRMTRKECIDFRNACFDYLHSKQIAPSSEEVNDWAVRSLVFCHYAPYSFMLDKPNAPRIGIPLPLFNLVYHECLIIPWFTDKTEQEDYLLYALLNGGIGYLDRDGAYAGCDGAFDTPTQIIDNAIHRAHTVAKLHEKVAHCEMVRHDFLNDAKTQQKTTFSDGTTVTIDLEKSTFLID